MSLKLIIALYAIGLLVTFAAFSYKMGCRARKHGDSYWKQCCKDEWQVARVFGSFLWPLSLIAVLFMLLVFNPLAFAGKLVENLGRMKGCPKITLDKS